MCVCVRACACVCMCSMCVCARACVRASVFARSPTAVALLVRIKPDSRPSSAPPRYGPHSSWLPSSIRWRRRLSSNSQPARPYCPTPVFLTHRLGQLLTHRLAERYHD